ncbi:glycosyltransferase [Acinetobacter johnsonii]
MKESILIQAWGIYTCNGKNYIEYTHYVYLKNILNIYKNIYLLSPAKKVDIEDLNNLYELSDDIIVYQLPEFSSYTSAYKNFFKYIAVYDRIKNNNFDLVYSRFPSPFGWLQKFYFKGKRVVHFVGDPIDTLIKNPKVSILKKIFKTIAFLPEYLFFIWSCFGDNVKAYSNGHHISDKLKKYKLNVKPMISSTLTENDFYEKSNSMGYSDVCKLIYVGYLRKAKGVDVVVEAFDDLINKFPGKFSLTIIGSGEEEDNLKKINTEKKLGINFLGHIDDRNLLNKLLREHDVFCFASVSEGSPRVILEAIANGLNVVTTPVGSLPYIFIDNEDLLYFDFNSKTELSRKIEMLSESSSLQVKLRKNSYEKVKKFKINSFIGEIFGA